MKQILLLGRTDEQAEGTVKSSKKPTFQVSHLGSLRRPQLMIVGSSLYSRPFMLFSRSMMVLT